MNYAMRIFLLVALGTIVTQQTQPGGRVLASLIMGGRVPTSLDASIKRWIILDGKTMAKLRLTKNGYTDEAVEEALARVERAILRETVLTSRACGLAITHEAAIERSKRKKKRFGKLSLKK